MDHKPIDLVFDCQGPGLGVLKVGAASEWDRKGEYNPSTRLFSIHHLGVSKNRGTPKWMVYNGKPY